MVSADAIAIAADRFSMLLTRFDGIVSSLPGEAFPRPSKENEEREREREAREELKMAPTPAQVEEASVNKRIYFT